MAPDTTLPENRRLLKRRRMSKPTTDATHDANHQHIATDPAPLDHIFIADGVTSRKAGVKKVPLSCCECRRLKLKCDRSFPCASCKVCRPSRDWGDEAFFPPLEFIYQVLMDMLSEAWLCRDLPRWCVLLFIVSCFQVTDLGGARASLHIASDKFGQGHLITLQPSRFSQFVFTNQNVHYTGGLVSGKGTRFILANTEQLHSKIQEMSDRIRNLEEALQSLHKAHSMCSHNSPPDPNQQEDDDAVAADPHPLMRPELLQMKSTMGLYTGTQIASSADQTTPAREQMDVDHRGSNKETVFVSGQLYPQQKPRESVQASTQLKFELQPSDNDYEPQPDADHFEAEIARLNHAFPLSTTNNPGSTSEFNPPLRAYIRSRLPLREEAEYLWEQARQNALWQYNPHSSPTFFPNLVHHIYNSPLPELCPRRLALLYMILSVGCLVDLGHRPDDLMAEKYHHLARASLCEIPVMEETTVETITVLFWEIWYLLVFSDSKKAVGRAWGIMGLTAKLAQSIDLHRNGKSKVIPEEVEQRRSLFWELLHLDARLSLSLGRPPSFSIKHMDTQRPSYIPDDGFNLWESLQYYQEWKHSSYLSCLTPVLDFITQPPSMLEYATVLDLDRRIRDCSILAPLRNNETQSRSIVMQKASLGTALEAVLLQLHRTFFTRALSGPEEALNRNHKYAPSVVAVFLSASRMIATVQDLYRREPQLTSRLLGYWSNAFSAAVALCVLVSRAPFTCLSLAALQELERARVLFRSAKATCSKATQVIPILESMIDKANDIYSRWWNGQEVPTIVLRHIIDVPYMVGEDAEQTGYQQQHYHQPQQQQYHHQQQRPQYQQPPTPYQLPQQTLHLQQQSDPFHYAHRSLAQCIVEVHERAKVLFPMRKPCACSASVAKSCPPSHSWSLPPNIPQSSPVLPPQETHHILSAAGLYSSATSTYSNGAYPPAPMTGPLHPSGVPQGLYSSTVLPSAPPVTKLSPTSKLAVVDTLNFELGALSTQSWMAFF